MDESTTETLLKLLAGGKTPTADEFKSLVLAVDTHNVLAKVFILEGVPFVFQSSPMKYVIFREQVAERFQVGSQDVCIVGSAKLGFSPSPTKYGKAFQEESDVDVVVISEALFHECSTELFRSINGDVFGNQPRQDKAKPNESQPVEVDSRNWKRVQESVRNYTYSNFNPSNLPDDSPLRQTIFEKISSTAGLFLALEPQVLFPRLGAGYLSPGSRRSPTTRIACDS